MSESNYWARTLSSRGIGRRAFLRSAALTGVGTAAFIAGCKSAPEKSAGSGASGGAAPTSNLGVFQVAEGKRGGQITDVGLDPTTGWDPHATAAQQTDQVMEPLHIKLIRHDYRKNFKSGGDQLIGELAEKWENPDPLTYNFTLRKGINWPNQEPMNGGPITAQDVEYTFKHAALPTSQVQGYIYDIIQSVTAIDATTVQLKLKKPNYFFPSDVDSLSSMILPKGYYEWAGQGAKDPAKARGGGPWLLDDYQPNSVIRFKANEAYRKVFGVPYADRLNVAVIATGSPRLQAWVAKNIQIFQPGAGEYEPAKKGRPDAKILEDVYTASGGTSLSIKSTQKPFDDVRVRRAMSMAIDRDGWGKTLRVPYKMEAGPIGWGYPDWKVEVSKMPAEVQKWTKVDIAEAKKLLDAAGFKPGTEFQMNYYPYSPDYQGWSQLLIDGLGKIGMTVKPKIFEYNNWLATAFIGKYQDLLFGPDASIDRPSPQLVDRLGKGSSRNHSDISDDETQKLLADFWGAKTMDEAKAVAAKVQIRSVDQVFSIYSPAPQAPILWDPPLQNFEGQRPFNHQFFYKDAFHWLA